MGVSKGNWFENQAEIDSKLQFIETDGTVNATTLNAATAGVTSLSTSSFTLSGPNIKMANLSEEDPGVAGQLWVDATDGYTIKVSQGS